MKKKEKIRKDKGKTHLYPEIRKERNDKDKNHDYPIARKIRNDKKKETILKELIRKAKLLHDAQCSILTNATYSTKEMEFQIERAQKHGNLTETEHDIILKLWTARNNVAKDIIEQAIIIADEINKPLRVDIDTYTKIWLPCNRNAWRGLGFSPSFFSF